MAQAAGAITFSVRVGAFEDGCARPRGRARVARVTAHALAAAGRVTAHAVHAVVGVASIVRLARGALRGHREAGAVDADFAGITVAALRACLAMAAAATVAGAVPVA